MGRKCKGKSPVNRSFSFRLENDFKTAVLEKKISKSGLTTSEFLRKLCEDEDVEIVAASPHKARAVFLLNKASNNLNQLAHRSNSAHKAGKLDQPTLSLIANELQKLNDFLLNQVQEASK